MRRVVLLVALLMVVGAPPVLAHGTGGGNESNGASLPLLLVGIAIAAGGLAYRRTLPALGVAAIVGAGVAIAIVSVLTIDNSSSRPDVHLAVTTPADGAKVPAGEAIAVEVDVDGLIASGPEDSEGGHLHLSVDGKLQQMPYTTSAEVTLDPGRHTIRVEYVDNRHRRYDPPIEHTIDVTAR